MNQEEKHPVPQLFFNISIYRNCVSPSILNDFFQQLTLFLNMTLFP